MNSLKQITSLETLILYLCLVSLCSKQQVVLETLEDIEELKQCFLNLNLDSILTPSKKQKLSAEKEESQAEARHILIDFLTSLLARPQAFLREMANSCFKNFCVDFLDQKGFEQLISIVKTPNTEAGQFMDGDQIQEDGADGELGEEVEESSDDDY